MKKVLITGSAGFIASHFIEHILKNTDWTIVGLESFKHRGDSERVIREDRLTTHVCDVASPISYRLMEKIGAVDFIVNMASDSHVDRSITDPVPFIQNNVNLSLSMLEYAREVRPAKFIQISTDEVYGAAPDGTNHKEWSAILPSNPYAASKAAQEAIAISYWRTYGVPLIITNTMNNFGERQDPEKYIPMLIQKIQKGDQVTIHGSPSYIGKRHYLHARNFADALLFLLKECNPNLYRDTDQPMLQVPARFNVVGQKELDNLEVAKLVSQFIGKDLRYRLVDFHSARPGHDRRYSLDGAALSAFGWKQPKELEESLEKMVSWTLAHPEWLT